MKNNFLAYELFPYGSKEAIQQFMGASWTNNPRIT